MAKETKQFLHVEIINRLNEQTIQTDNILADLDAVLQDPGIDALGLTYEQFETLKTDVTEFNKELTGALFGTNTLPHRFDDPLELYSINNPSHPSLEARLNGIVDDDKLAAYIKSTEDLIKPAFLEVPVSLFDDTIEEVSEVIDYFAAAEKDQDRMEADWELSEQNAEKMKNLDNGWIEGIDKKSKITPNWTTAVDLPTYHITLYMVNIPVFNDPASYLKEKSDISVFGASANLNYTEQQQLLNDQYVGIEDENIVSETPRAIIVAESGTTASYSIDNLVIEDVQSAPSNRGSTYSTESSFDISEPGGFSFITKVMAMSRMLDFSSFNDARFIIQVDFMATDETTGNNISYPSTMASDKTPARSLYYPVMVHSIHSSTDVSGSKYMFKCMHTGTIAAYNRINSALTMNNVVTVGDLLDGLQDQLNKYERRAADVGGGITIADEWAIRFNIAPKDNGSLPSEQEGLANMLDSEFLKFPLVEATPDQLKTESDPVKSTSMTTKQDPNVQTKDEKIAQSYDCAQSSSNSQTSKTSKTSKTKQQVDTESRTNQADGDQYEMVKNIDPVSWLRTKLVKVPLFYKTAKELKDEFNKYTTLLKEGGESNLPPYNLIPKIVIDTAIHTSDNKHTRTGKYAKTTILNIQIVWEAIPGLDISDYQFQKRNFKTYNILKRYNYMFSGENTEVRKFDLSHNMLFNNVKYLDAPETDIHLLNEKPKINSTDIIPKYLADLEVNDIGQVTNIDMRPTYVIDEMPNQSSINNSGESTEDNKDAQLSAKFQDEQSRMVDNMNIDLNIIGDPDWMVGRDTILTDAAHPIISNFIAEGSGDLMSPQSHHERNYTKLGNGDLGAGVDVGEEDLVGVASIYGITGNYFAGDDKPPIGLHMRTPALPCISFINILQSPSIFEAWNGDK
jgi:hypothetical protein